MSLGSPAPGDGEDLPGEPGRFTRSLRRSGLEPGPQLTALEALLDEQLRRVALGYGQLRLRMDQGAHQIDGLLLGDEDSPVAGQLADMAGASRSVAATLRGQAREAAELLVELRRAAAAASALADAAEARRLAPPATPPGTLP